MIGENGMGRNATLAQELPYHAPATGSQAARVFAAGEALLRQPLVDSRWCLASAQAGGGILSRPGEAYRTLVICEMSGREALQMALKLAAVRVIFLKR